MIIHPGITIIDNLIGPGLVSYISEKCENIPVVLYTDHDNLPDGTLFSDIFIISGEFLTEDLYRKCDGKIFSLGESGRDLTGVEILCRFLPADDLLSAVYDTLLKCNIYLRGFGSSFSEKELVGFYAPGGMNKLSDLTFAFASVRGEECKTLYINFSLFEFRFKDEAYDAGDLFYYMRSTDLSLGQIAGAISNERAGPAVIAGFSQPEDLSDITADDFELLFSRILSETDYECIVVQAPENAGCIRALQLMCTKFYCVSDETAVGDSYVKEFRESMPVGDDLTERFGELKIPGKLLSGDPDRHDFTGFMREVLR
ncbi:MAG: hypothetical protein K5929_02005 [Lachnospiraceae bacterium]|nr:hypothetical protein [Lachnospiraceae bacterium]